jgi:amino acid ABC transporter
MPLSVGLVLPGTVHCSAAYRGSIRTMQANVTKRSASPSNTIQTQYICYNTSVYHIKEDIPMKKFKQLLCLALALTISASLLAACGQKNNGGSKDSDEKVLTYAVEGGSAGEEIALEKGWKVTTLEDQAAALMEVASGTSDAAIIDLLMAGAMIGEGTSYPDLTYTDRLTEEEYGIGCRKGSDLAQYINCVLGDAYQSGTMQKLAQQYGITEELLVPQQESTFTTGEDSDVSYIQQKGTLVVGITEFAPMDYKDENGQWIGFDADLAKLVAERLGVEIQFVVIDWGQKINELDSKAIDVVWNGMTLTDGVTSAMACTNAYCKNAQVVVVRGQ